MGGKSSKPTDSSRESKNIADDYYTAVPEELIEPLVDTDIPLAAAPEELLQPLIDAGIPLQVGLSIINDYVDIHPLRETSPFNPQNPSQFFISRQPYTLFGRNFCDLAEADQHCIWGRPDEVKLILERLEKNPDGSLIKKLLTASIGGEDHRGSDFIPQGTLLERALCLEDVLIQEEKSHETMAGMLQHYLLANCGKDEVNRQTARALSIKKEDETKKEAAEPDDAKAVNTILTTLANTDPKNLEENAELKTAMTTFDAQLRKPGNYKIISKISQFCEAHFSEENYNSPRRIFAMNRILGLAQLRRLSACELQMSFPGLYQVANRVKEDEINGFTGLRIDVRKVLGVLATALDSSHPCRLGFNCHLSGFGIENSGATDSLLVRHQQIELCKNSALSRIMSGLDNPSNPESCSSVSSSRP